MEPPDRPDVPLDEPQSAELAEANESPRTWSNAAKRNYWAKLDQREFARFPVVKPLPYLEESRLFERAQNGDMDARNILWTRHLRLAFSVVNRFHLPHSQLADAIQEAALGLVSAIERFDVYRLNAFSTYAWYWMEQRIGKFQVANRYAVPIPAHLYAEYHRFEYGLRRCRSRADWFDWREEWLSTHPKIFQRLSRFHALAEPQPLDDAGDLAYLAPDLASEMENDDTHRLLDEAIGSLSPRKQHILTRRYGLDGEPEETLAEIGVTLGLTRERVRQLQVSAEKKLHRILRDWFAGRNGKC